MKKPRDLRMYLRDVLESCDQIVAYIGTKDAEAFRKDTQAQDAVMRRFGIIGEAVKHVPAEFRLRYPEVSWTDAAAFRDVLAHDYPEIVIDEVYFTGRNQLPPFRDQIQKVLDGLAAE